jgi:hypothetical protein
VKSQLVSASEVWSPKESKLKGQIERVQRRATRWILRTRFGEMSYKDRLKTLNLLPLCYDREIKDLTFFYKSLYGQTDLNVFNFVKFVNHGRTRLSQNPGLVLETPLCKSSTFKCSYFNRIVHLWNSICKTATPSVFSSLSQFKSYLRIIYFSLLDDIFDVDSNCTWSLVRQCPCHK